MVLATVTATPDKGRYGENSVHVLIRQQCVLLVNSTLELHRLHLRRPNGDTSFLSEIPLYRATSPVKATGNSTRCNDFVAVVVAGSDEFLIGEGKEK